MFSLTSVQGNPWLSDLSHGQPYSDIVLKGSAGNEIATHKIVLASSSPVFEAILRDIPVYPGPLVIVPDASDVALTSLINFLQSEELTFMSESSYEAFLKLMHLLGIDYVNRCCTIEGGVSNDFQRHVSFNGDPLEAMQMNHDGELDYSANTTAVDDQFHYSDNSELTPAIDHTASVDHYSDSGEVTVTPDISCFSHGATLKGEINPHETEVEQSVSGSDPPPKKFADVMHTCVECGRCFASADYLEKHAKRAHGRGEFRCHLCGSTLTQRCNLFKHMREVHEKTNAFECVDCARTFTRRTALHRHRASVHGRIARFCCDICGKSYTTKVNMQSHHSRVHTGEKPFCCSRCGKTFATSGECDVHQRSCLNRDNVLSSIITDVISADSS